jgi:hypothetical protein
VARPHGGAGLPRAPCPRRPKAQGGETESMKNPLESLSMTVALGLIITVVMVLLVPVIGS